MNCNISLATQNISRITHKNHIKVEISIDDEIKKIKEETTPERKPVFLIPVIDKSGSMGSSVNRHNSNTKMEAAKDAAISLVNLLNEGDKIAIISFDDSIDVVQKPIEYNEKIKSEIVYNISKIHTGGCTNISGSLDTAFGLFDIGNKEDYNCKIILLSDGQANVGLETAIQFESFVEKFIGNGITISTVGIGDSYDLDIMDTIANCSGGTFHHVNNASEVCDIFCSELKLAKAVLATGVSMYVHIPYMVEFKENLNGYKQKFDGDNIKIDFGSMYGSKCVYFEMDVLDTNRKNIPITVDIKYTINNEEKSLSTTKKCLITDDDAGIEDRKLLEEITNLIKQQYYHNASSSYSCGSSDGVSHSYNASISALSSMSSSYDCCINYCSAISDEITQSNTSFVSNSVSNDEVRNMFSASANSLRNGYTISSDKKKKK